MKRTYRNANRQRPNSVAQAHLDFAFAEVMLKSCAETTAERKKLAEIADLASEVLYRAGVPLSTWGRMSFSHLT